MTLLTEDGMRIPIDIDTGWSYEKAALVNDSVELEDVWVVELQRGNGGAGDNYELEWFKDVKLDHEPSENEILRIMIINGMSVHDDIAFVRRGHRIKV